ncbi:MAG: hypothetical protein K2Q03_03605 [Sphingobacteriaceae bacterium]|nr:hypothetical protein [Sphingobacteriaceae bacterium]
MKIKTELSQQQCEALYVFIKEVELIRQPNYWDERLRMVHLRDIVLLLRKKLESYWSKPKTNICLSEAQAIAFISHFQNFTSSVYIYENTTIRKICSDIDKQLLSINQRTFLIN